MAATQPTTRPHGTITTATGKVLDVVDCDLRIDGPKLHPLNDIEDHYLVRQSSCARSAVSVSCLACESPPVHINDVVKMRP